jgi:hypothetical protein
MPRMPEDPLRDVIEGFRARFQAELDAQLRALTDHQAETVERVRRATEAEVDGRWAARIEELRDEFRGRLAQEVTAARQEAERAASAEALRARLEFQQEAAENAGRIRREIEESVAAERRQAADAIEAERVNEAHAVAQAVAQAAIQAQTAIEERQKAEDTLEAERAKSAQAAAQLQAALHEREQAEVDRQRADDANAQVRASFDVERAELERAISAARAELDAARHEHQQNLADARAGVDAEKRGAEQTLAEVRAAVEAEKGAAEQAIAQVRAAAAARVREAEATLAQLRADLDAEKRAAEQARTSLEAERRRSAEAIPRQPVAPDLTRLREALRSIDASESLTAALAAAVKGAGAEAPRAALFIVSGSELQEWAVPGVPTLSAGVVSAGDGDAGMLVDALRRHEPVWSAGNGGGPKAPAFASLPSGRSAVATPLVLGGEVVAVLYADDGREGSVSASWRDSVQILATHATACLAYLTAARTAQAMQLLTNPAGAPASPATSPEDDSGARRYARLLLSEIRLYNEVEVQLGRQNRDLMTRLKPEIERARRLYEERVSESVGSRDRYFQQELVQTLADGDAALLG